MRSLDFPKDAHVKLTLCVVALVIASGCQSPRVRRRAPLRGCESTPAPVVHEAEANAITTASFELTDETAEHQAGGYLQSAPNFPVQGPAGWWAAHAGELELLKSKSQELMAQNQNLLEELGDTKESLEKTRLAMETSINECNTAKEDLDRTREQLIQWQRSLDTSLRAYQADEDRHLAELDRVIETIQGALNKQAPANKKTREEPAVLPSPSDQ